MFGTIQQGQKQDHVSLILQHRTRDQMTDNVTHRGVIFQNSNFHFIIPGEIEFTLVQWMNPLSIDFALCRLCKSADVNFVIKGR